MYKIKAIHINAFYSSFTHLPIAFYSLMLHVQTEM